VAEIADDLGDGVERAAEAIDDGRAAAVLEAWVRTSVAARDAGSG
jgi:anthranilate phosphoribosyltransferase